MTLLKKIAFASLILLISSVVFYIFIKDQQVKDDMLRVALSAFGNQLLAMVPEGEEKKVLEKKYQDFLHKAEQNQIPEEKIEKVAAIILNYANQDTVISAREGLAVLDLPEAIDAPVFLEAPPDPEKHSLPAAEPTHLKWETKNREKLAQRLLRMQELNVEINALSDAFPVKDKIVFSADSGLRVTLDTDLRMMIQNPKLEKEIEHLEEQNLLKWQIDVPSEIVHGLKHYMKYVPSDVQDNLPQDVKMIWNIVNSVNIDSFAHADPDSLKKFIEIQFELRKQKNPPVQP